MKAVLRPVDGKRAIPVLLSALDTANLSTPAVERLLRNGDCSVLMDAAVPEDRLYRFNEGGLTPAGQHTPRPGYVVAEVRRCSVDLARALSNGQKFGAYYVHDPLKRPEEVPATDGPFLTVEGQLLYSRDASHLSVDGLSDLISRNSLSWHFLMFCTPGPLRGYDRMADLLADSSCLVSGIYDGESYMVWVRAAPAITAKATQGN